MILDIYVFSWYYVHDYFLLAKSNIKESYNFFGTLWYKLLKYWIEQCTTIQRNFHS